MVRWFDPCPHPYGMRPRIKGLSHGLKTCHRHVFLTAFRVLFITHPIAKTPPQKRRGLHGVGDGTRTHNARNHNPVLCQLNYTHHILFRV